jgi:hypothetical protein
VISRIRATGSLKSPTKSRPIATAECAQDKGAAQEARTKVDPVRVVAAVKVEVARLADRAAHQAREARQVKVVPARVDLERAAAKVVLVKVVLVRVELEGPGDREAHPARVVQAKAVQAKAVRAKAVRVKAARARRVDKVARARVALRDKVVAVLAATSLRAGSASATASLVFSSEKALHSRGALFFGRFA